MAFRTFNRNTITSTSKTDKSTTSKVELAEKRFLEGTTENDIIYGDSGDNNLYGVGGDDILIGDPGADELHGGITDEETGDTADYSDSNAAVTVNLTTGKGRGGYAEGDRLVSIENVVGSHYNDKLYGDANSNVLNGGRGNDRLDGRGGDDTLIGGIGNDVLIGGTGKDVLIGGSDTDTASYSTARGSVMADLAAGMGTYGDAFGDTYSSIENLTGSAYTDWLWGDDKSNVISGGGSADYLYGRGGADTLKGGSGNDVLDGGHGADILQGGSGIDEADYSGSDSAVDVKLSGTSSGGTAEGDTYSSVENARGSQFNDKFHGTSSSNEFWGEEGNDTFYGDGGSDTFNGGQGSDTANYYSSESAVNVYLTTGQGFSGDAHGDRYSSIENIVGSRAAGNALIGNGEDNHIVSHGLRDDRIEGGEGRDTIEVRGREADVDAGGGDDTIEIWDVEDHASWEAYSHGKYDGDPTLIDGGEGNDTIDFGNQTTWINLGSGRVLAKELGVNVDLELGNGEYGKGYYFFHGMHLDGNVDSSGNLTGDAHTTQGDIWNVENVIGTQYNDTIRGDNFDNILNGEQGNDYLSGDDGNDTLIGGAGADELRGGEGIDTADYTGSNAGVEVSLGEDAGPAKGGHAEGDTLEEIENLVGSGHGDILVGSAGDNEISGGDGADVIDGAGGNDILTGGEGADEFLFGAEFHFTESNVTITDFEVGVDTLNLNHLSGFDNAADVMANMTQDGADAVFTYEGSTITLENVDVADLSAENFIV